jgi:hypothetical protein
MITIEKGVKLPKSKGRQKVINWEDMEVGDSFPHPYNAAMYCTQQAKESGKDWQFTGKKQQDGSFRIWRLK